MRIDDILRRSSCWEDVVANIEAVNNGCLEVSCSWALLKELAEDASTRVRKQEWNRGYDEGYSEGLDAGMEENS